VADNATYDITLADVKWTPAAPKRPTISTQIPPIIMPQSREAEDEDEEEEEEEEDEDQFIASQE
jgi:hypothetical protein